MAAPKCVACEVERKLVFAEVVNARYEVRSFRCPVCKTTLRLVEAREPRILPKQQRAKRGRQLKAAPGAKRAAPF